MQYVSGRIIPSFENNVWTYTEEIFAEPYVSACHFYAKNNFVIGAVDAMLYSNFSTANEIAVFWYCTF
ncbi:hypothetical protein D0A23_10435 [Bacillus amyloliquefaciens]|nr:hypothetical protein [Bacillus amyloliquefaciens]MCM3248802.1 hypothetical protein [Bacillus amyloliquefaciens]MCY7423686.1 hypothetical protein [Bacillus amyloliquefaciens]QDP94445.1 hypothetical protein FOG69_12630 [Bacillus amyloliquefaciens]QZY24865.1 hypothetical protein K7I17_13100 [Bacillus amyloliquefaciens]RHX69470.1 hypothetical protein D0A23_10435 [Bacillus amyloliquefaciens]